MIDERAIAHRHRLLAGHLTDHELRLWAATEATVHGPGAIATIARATGITPAITPAAIRRAQRELRDRPPATDSQRSSD
jgi:hypothetical protein